MSSIVEIIINKDEEERKYRFNNNTMLKFSNNIFTVINLLNSYKYPKVNSIKIYIKQSVP